VLMNKDADRVNSYNIWNYAEGHDSYYASMLIDLTLPPDEVSQLLHVSLGRQAKQIHVEHRDTAQ